MPQMWAYWWCLNTKLFSIVTYCNNEIVQHCDIPPIGGHTKSRHRCGLTDDAEHKVVQHHDLLEQCSCSALWHTTLWWSYKSCHRCGLTDDAWTQIVFDIKTCRNNEPVQHYDIPPVGGHIKSCHRCGLTDDAWKQGCSASWPAGTMNLFSIMTIHRLVVI